MPHMHLFAQGISIVLLALTVAFLGAPTNFAQELPTQDGEIIMTGRVTSDVDGSPLPEVRIILEESYFLNSFDVARTDSSGHYTVTSRIVEQWPDLVREDPLAYYVYFQSNGSYVSEYYDDSQVRHEAARVTLTLGSEVSGIDASLALGGQMWGAMHYAENDEPVADARGFLYDQTRIGDYTDVVPNDTGVFSITGIVPGIYKFYVAPTDGDTFHVAVYYPSTQFIAEAEEFHITAGDIFTDINVSLPLGGKISGTVTSSRYGSTLGMSPLVYDTNGRLVPSEDTFVDNSSGYILSNLLPGEYRLLFEDSYNEHRSEYYDDQPTLDKATFVSVKAGAVTPNINAELAFTASVTSIATSAALPNHILLALKYDDAPVFTADSGRSWQQVSTTPWAHSYRRFSDLLIGLTPRTEPGSPRRLLAVDGNSVFRTGDNGQSWAQHELPSLDGECTSSFFHIENLIVSPIDPRRIYLVDECNESDIFGIFVKTKIFISHDAALSWQQRSVTISTYIDQLVPSPVMIDRLYVGNNDYRWLQSDDGGENWVEKHFPLGLLALDAQDSGRLYGVTPPDYSGVPEIGMRSEDGGESWVKWAQQPCGPGQIDRASVSQLVADHKQTRLLFLRCTQGLFRSEDSGDSWTQLSPTPGQLLAMDYGVPGRILWGKEDGLWASTDSGESWQPIMPDYEPSVAAPQTPLFLPSIVTNQP